MKKYKIRHKDGTVKEVSEIELAKYGLEIPKAQNGMEVAQGTPQEGGAQQMEQIMAMAAQALEQGASPEEVMQLLVEQGVPQEQAQQVIGMAMQQLQPETGALPQAELGIGVGDQPLRKSNMLTPGIQQEDQTFRDDPTGLRKDATNLFFRNKTRDYVQNNNADPNYIPEINDLNPPMIAPPNTNPLGLPPVVQEPVNNPKLTNQIKRHNTSTSVNNTMRNVSQMGPPFMPSSYLSGAINSFQDIGYANQYAKDNPNMTDEKRKQLNRYKGIAGANATFNMIGQGVQDVRTGLGAFVSGKVTADAKREEDANFRLFNSERARRSPEQSNYETRYATGPMAKYGKKLGFGGKLGYLKTGGNVQTERGEIINNTMTAYQDGGVTHEHPSGGNVKYLLPGSVVHSKTIGIDPNDFLSMINPAKYGAKMMRYGGIVGDEPEITPVDPQEVLEHTTNMVASNIKKPGSFADLAKPFVNQIQELEKDIMKTEKKRGKNLKFYGNKGVIGDTTAALNDKLTYKPMLKSLEELRQLNLEATGPEGPIHLVSEALKAQGAYPGIENDNAKAKHGKVILPRFQDGGRTRRIKKLDVDNEAAFNAGIATSGVVTPSIATGASFNQGTWDQVSKEDKRRLHEGYLKSRGTQGIPGDDYYDQWLNNPTGKLNDYQFISNDPDFTDYIFKTMPNGKSLSIPQATQPVVTPSTTAQSVTPTVQSQLPYDASQGRPTPPGYGTREHFIDLLKNATEHLGTKMPYYHDQTSAKELATAYQRMIGKYAPGILKNIYAEGAIPYTDTGKQLYQKHNPTDTDGVSEQELRSFFEANPDLIDDQFMDDLPGIRGVKFGKKDFKTRVEYDEWLKNKNAVGGNYYFDPTEPKGGTANVYIPSYKEDIKKEEPLPGITPLNRNSEGTASRRRLYAEGLNPLQLVGPMAALLTPRDAAPYIEDQGAKDALAATTKKRLTEIQPQLNRLRRATLAQTRNMGNTPVQQARGAQAYANEYENANQAYGNKYGLDAAIEQQYMDTQNQLRMAAGTNRAKALDTLAQRSATSRWKKTAMDINALGGISDKYLKNNLENKTSLLYQDMFPNVGYNGMTTDVYGNDAPLIGGASTPLNKEDIQKRILTNKQKLQELKIEEEELKKLTGQKYGGKVKLPKKSIKRVK